jgi:hypothetical protein
VSDHDPESLEALAHRIEQAAARLEAETGRLAPGPRAAARRLPPAARDAGALLGRLAGDLRIVGRLLQDVRLLAPTADEREPDGSE